MHNVLVRYWNFDDADSDSLFNINMDKLILCETKPLTLIIAKKTLNV